MGSGPLKLTPEELERWKQGSLKKAEEKTPPRREEFTTASGAPVAPLYSPLDRADDWSYAEHLGFPGEYPFTRGVQPTMYRGRFWTMRQYAGFGNAEDTNRRFRYLLEQGQTGLSVAFDLPTQIGYDSDAELAEGEIGRVGVAIDSLADMELLFDGIPLDKVSVSMTINSTVAVLLAMLVAVARKQGVEGQALRGTVQNDILKEYVARGTYIFPPAQSMRIVTDVFRYCADELPKFNMISISGYHMREAGCTAAQEVAFTIADGMAYVRAALECGMKVDEFAPRLSFFFAAHNDLIEEVAKFRAARRLWARTMKEGFGAEDPKSMMMRFHTQTGGSTLTAQQPDNNVVRVTIQALAAVLGGTQSLHTNSRDEALALPTEQSARLALRTQQVIAHESGVADTPDPLAGSYAVEAMTDRIEAEATDYIGRIDEMGGMVKAIEQGYVQREISEAAYRYQKSIDDEERIIVGVNSFQAEEEPPEHLHSIDQSVADAQMYRLSDLRERRDDKAVSEALAAVKAAAASGDNLMPPLVEAVSVYATLGEICDVLRDEFGEHREDTTLF
jgi:methylmalonyl-CoA mutase N-terminal domain/subunit